LCTTAEDTAQDILDAACALLGTAGLLCTAEDAPQDVLDAARALLCTA